MFIHPSQYTINMNKLLFTLFTYFFITFSFSQENARVTLENEISKLSYLDSIKATFINHSTSNCIDKRWLEELTNKDLSESMFSYIDTVNIDSVVTFDLSTALLIERLQTLDAKSPFNISYSPALENVIKSFLKNRKQSLQRLMAISDYYFPMFEEHLAKYNIPLEIKYLAIVESALNPRAKSRVGASGLWQFMYPTGKQFNLEVTSYVDERFDPLMATEAACQYLSSLYTIFGDWSLVLASYNAGPGNVSKAIRRSGGSQNYWNIRKNLPRETANYVPAFLATMYINEYKKEHGFEAAKSELTYFETDTIAVKKQISFQQIADVLDISIEQIQFLNPIYKLDIIPFIPEKQHFLRLPKDKIGLFVSNEEAIYAYLDYLNNQREKINIDEVNSSSIAEPTIHYHKIKSGESLGLIADKYKIPIAKLRKWNNIRGNTIRAGKTLKIFSTEKNVSKTVYNATNGKMYTVKSGDSLYSIASKYPGVSANNLKEWNDISGNYIKPGMKLKIRG